MSGAVNVVVPVLAGCAIYILVWQCWCIALIAAIVVHVLQHKQFYAVAWQTLPRDASGLVILVKLKLDLHRRMRDDKTVNQIFVDEILPTYRSKIAMISVDTGEEYTFDQLDQAANQAAHYFKKAGLKEGDVVALLMCNSPQYVITWLGLSRVGVISAWINTNLRQTSLVHCINIAECRAIICDAQLQSAVGEIIDGSGGLTKPLPVHVYGAVHHPNLIKANSTDFAVKMHECSKFAGDFKLKQRFTDNLCYIYTSGTTGLPKAAVLKHVRYYFMFAGIGNSFGITADDRIYVTMPMYHSAAGVLGVGQMLLRGSTLVIRTKFSATRFWPECVQYRCTATQYIGELCRYLLAQPECEAEKHHSIRLMYGNGLRPEIWNQMVARYGIQRIGEFYGSTEGNSNIVNTFNYPGAVGFMPIYPGLHKLFPVSLIKVDETTGEIIRSPDGLCIMCGPGDTGQMVGRIVKNDALLDFNGYVGKAETEKKVIRNVFHQGDMVFSSGDLLYMDKLGYLYFKDRTGDTFRWKGENVSTTEVETVMHRLLSLSDATVFGVEIPGCDGKAGMAAVVDEKDDVDLDKLADALKHNLPAYARPIFIRVCKAVEQTGTFKLKKTNLQKDGYSVSACGADRLYYMDNKSGKFNALTQDIEQQIKAGKIRF